MKNKKIAPLIFVIVVVGVFYFIYRAFISESLQESQIDQQIELFEKMKSDGLKEFTSQTISNQEFHFSSVSNPIVILNFWASWCGPCVEEFPSLIKMVQSFKGQVALVAVSLDTDEDQMKEFLKSYNTANANIFLLKDPDFQLARSLGTYKLPESYVLDNKRILLRKISGSVNWSSKEMIHYLKSLFNQPVKQND